jgi:hypothetical protein
MKSCRSFYNFCRTKYDPPVESRARLRARYKLELAQWVTRVLTKT